MNVMWILSAVGILVGTYTVRVLPFWFGDFSRLSPRVRRFLEVVPPAALGALIAPDAFLGVSPIIAGTVVITSVVLGLRGVGITIVVAIAIGLTWIGITLGV